MGGIFGILFFGEAKLGKVLSGAGSVGLSTLEGFVDRGGELRVY